MITGTLPFRMSSAAAVCVAHLQEPVPSIGFSDQNLTQSLDALIGKMTAKNKEERFQSAKKF